MVVCPRHNARTCRREMFAPYNAHCSTPALTTRRIARNSGTPTTKPKLAPTNARLDHESLEFWATQRAPVTPPAATPDVIESQRVQCEGRRTTRFRMVGGTNREIASGLTKATGRTRSIDMKMAMPATTRNADQRWITIIRRAGWLLS